MSSKLVKKKQDGSPLTLIIMSDTRTGAGYKAFVEGATPFGAYAVGNTVKVSKAYKAGYDNNNYNNGKPLVMLQRCEFIDQD